jgi:hypothetical protein
MLVCHRCDNPPCVNPDHLFLGDHKINADDMISKGRGGNRPAPKGADNWSAKVDENDVRTIRLRRQRGERQVDLMREYGLSKAAIAALTTRRTWKHVA